MRNVHKKSFIKLFAGFLLTTTVFCSACNVKTIETDHSNYSVAIDKPTGIDKTEKVADLAKNNQTNYTIVHSVDAGEAVVQGAKEIQSFLLESASAYAKIVSDENLLYSESSKYISVGKTKALKESGLSLDYSLLKHDGFFMKTKDNSVFIDGISDRGVLYGAYDFCEKVLGVKYLTSDYNYVPKTEEVSIYKMDITDNPAFEDRVYQASNMYNMPQYVSRMRFVHEYIAMPEIYGGGIGWFDNTTYVGNYVHNTLYYVKPETYLHEHPEWFFDDGDKICDLCYSHVGLNEDGTVDESLEESPVKVAIAHLKEILLASSDPSVKYYMIGQMDLSYTCQCHDCLEQEEKYGRSGMNIRFVNAIYDNVSKWAKENGIDKEWYLCTFAYQWSQSAPVKLVKGKYQILDETVMPRDNVIVRIAPIQANNYYGMIEEGQNDKTRDLFNGWSALLKGKKTMIWSYHARFSYYFCYYPTIQHWQQDFKLYEDIGAHYIFMQSVHNEPHEWKAKMEAYVASKMLWNPDLNAIALRDEFIHYYYGELEPLVQQYNLNFEIQFANMTSREDAPNLALQGEDEILDAKYYSTFFFEKQLALLDEMYEKVGEMDISRSEKDSAKMKVDELKLTTEFMLLYHYDSYYFDDYWGKQAMMDDFFDTCTALQITNWRESNGKMNTLHNLFGYNS